MIEMTDKVLHYGGLILGAGALFALIVFFLVMKIARLRLEAKFDAEYGGRK